MTAPRITVERVGREEQPVVVLDDFAADPAALCAAAIAARWDPAAHHYPGIRAPLPDSYLSDQLPVIADVLREEFGEEATPAVIDASFSIVTSPVEQLSVRQRLPHCDANARGRIAFVHYLSDDPDGTAFYRHRSTGFESVDVSRAAIFAGQIDAELRLGGPPPMTYVFGDTPLFERTAAIEARPNRALVYRSFVLHSGSISPDATLSPDPASGRLTVTGFLSVGEAR